MIDYLNDLREGCLEAYTGIIQGMKGEGSPAAPTAELLMVQPHVTHVVQVCQRVLRHILNLTLVQFKMYM